MKTVAAILTEEGFLAEVTEPGGGSPRLRLCHCPLREVVAVSHLPCRAELALVEELLGCRLERETFIPDGASACTYALLDRSPDVATAGAAIPAGRR